MSSINGTEADSHSHSQKSIRDIQLVLARWGVWARYSSGLDYSSIAAGFKGLLPDTAKSKASCCDDDGLVVDGCVARLKQYRPDEYDLIIRHYVLNQSKRAIARQQKRDEKLIRINMQMAEGFIDGCLAMLNVKLEMDPLIEHLYIYEKTLTRSAKSVLV
ncbi:antitermination protein Q [Yersinia kristensenii]|nr:antiterminator Q family protein [Yersinia kristensenii]NIK93859.1 antitermination protein Q [Yersinia kristensenii]NIL07857.1 antitermination protein Q [Yersinia kristensenii]PJE85295.1 antitermination protein Q [Yersinia kristensenii]CNG67400.1 phage antitermination protein Q [Yersinia kristensenii]CNJ50350.1 phage antitermination protein Q [Yersinia kristensenii]